MYLNAVLPISTFFFMNITVKTVHICRFTDRYYLWNDRFSVLSQKFCPFNMFKGFLDLFTGYSGISRSNAKNCSGFFPPTRKSGSLKQNCLF